MRVHVVAALALLATLHLAAPHLAPRTVPSDRLADHLGERVAVEGWVRGVDPGESVTRIDLEDPGGRARVLLRAAPPPMGARVRVIGDLAPDPGGPVLWADGAVEILEQPDPAARSLAEVLEAAPQLEGTSIAVVGGFDPNASRLEGAGGSLPVRIVGAAPPEDRVVLWGTLVYASVDASYRLEATGWSPWAPSAS